jgi:uncharacterized membrane protein
MFFLQWLIGIATIVTGAYVVKRALRSMLNLIREASKESRLDASGAMIYIRACKFVVASGLFLLVIGFVYLMFLGISGTQW